MIAYCGLICDTCPIHLATIETDKSRQEVLRREIVTLCNENYGMNLVFDDVTDCDGCCADTGRIFPRCQACEIRICARQKGLESCAVCPGYPCKSLESVFREDPGAKGRLDTMHGIRS